MDGAQNSSSLLCRLSLHRSGCPAAHSVDHTGLELTETHLFLLLCAGIKVCNATMPRTGALRSCIGDSAEPKGGGAPGGECLLLLALAFFLLHTGPGCHGMGEGVLCSVCWCPHQLLGLALATRCLFRSL